MSPADKPPILIVGLYKCGTSWLLSSLGSHPNAVAVAELDVIRCTHDVRANQTVPVAREEWLARFFSESSWLRVPPANRAVARELIALGALGSVTIPELLDLSVVKMNTKRRLKREAVSTILPIASGVFRLQSLIEMYDSLTDARDAMEALNRFHDAIAAEFLGDYRVVLKAADQIAVLATVNQWQPQARKLVIIRDGRDASISGVHYRRLMSTQENYAAGGERGFDELLGGWTARAKLVAEAAEQGHIKVVRYEDLSANYERTLGAVLRWLELDASPELVSQIGAANTFENVTGRKRGEEAAHVVRKGMVGEWKETLDAAEQEQAWNKAGTMLERFGYARDGSLSSEFPGRIA